MNIIESSLQILDDLKDLLLRIPKNDYNEKSEILFHASIGQHCRHILEFYQCLIGQHVGVMVCYDLRKRDLNLEELPAFAVKATEEIMEWLKNCPVNHDLSLYVSHDYENNGEHNKIASSLYRELAFNIEHTIHHMAIIKIGLKIINSSVEVDEHFGVAPSTVRHYNQVAQVLTDNA